MNEHECQKSEVITIHGEALKYLKKEVNEISEWKKNMTTKLEVIERGLATSEVLIGNFDKFMVEYKKDAPEAKKSIQKMMYFLISGVVTVILALGGFMAYQNNIIVTLQEENKQLILKVIKPSVPSNKTTQ